MPVALSHFSREWLRPEPQLDESHLELEQADEIFSKFATRILRLEVRLEEDQERYKILEKALTGIISRTLCVQSEEDILEIKDIAISALAASTTSQKEHITHYYN